MVRYLSLASCVLLLTGFYGCVNQKQIVPRLNQSDAPERLTDFVDTRAGSAGVPWASGKTSPAASLPFGFVKLGADTHTFGKIWSTSGYHYGDAFLKGFSHTRLSGTGVWEGGVLRAIPFNQAADAGVLSHPVMAFRHDQEIARPGYYQVQIQNLGIVAQFTATAHVGLHRYCFTRTSEPHLYLDLKSHLSAKGHAEIVSADILPSGKGVRGSIRLFDDFSQRYGGLEIFFYARSDQARALRWVLDEGAKRYLDWEFGEADKNQVELHVALSLVSQEGAENNYRIEVGALGRTFERIETQARDQWESVFSRARILEGRTVEKAIFYGSLYRSFQMPIRYGDAAEPGGAGPFFRGFDGKVYTSKGYTYYSDFSLWDTFRTVHPLFNLMARAEQADMMRSLLTIADQTGYFPRFPSAGGPTGSMLGLPAHIVLAESYLKGIRGFDVERAYRVMRRVSTSEGEGLPERECLDTYIRFGYCPSDVSGDSVALSLEYGYADAATAGLAAALGKESDAIYFTQRSQNYRNLWSEHVRAFVPRDSKGRFEEDVNLNDSTYLGLTKAARHYREGSANQWRWYVPWDPKGLEDLFQGSFQSDLEAFFSEANAVRGSIYPSSAYWHGNEPDIHAAFLFSAVGHPEASARWTRWILKTRYSADAQSLDGDDDAGTLSAWYVFASLGFYPVAGTTRYLIGLPLFSKAELAVGQYLLHIRAEGAPDKAYVCSVSLNGEKLSNPWFEHGQISKGGDLSFEMSDGPCR